MPTNYPAVCATISSLVCQEANVRATLRVDAECVVGTIDPNVYGNFAEHLGRCIYGGIYQLGSLLSDERGFRTDVAEAVRRLRVTNLRWPGGNFVSGYHWLDGVGPREQRPRRHDLAWDAIEPNQFGTDDFIAYCRLIDTVPYICLNLGTGTIDEAADWLTYCNSDDATYYAELRRKNGHAEPYGVPYWGLGNELYGEWQIGHKTATEYARVAEETAKALRRTDPSIKLVACGAQRVDWDWEVLHRTARYVDYVSAHFYFRPLPEEDPILSLFGAAYASAEYLDVLAGLIAGARREQKITRGIAIAVDEWNSWYRQRRSPLEERYDLTDAVCVASFLNLLRRRAAMVTIANLAQLVNVIAPIFTSDEGLFLQTIYWPLYAAANLSGPWLVDSAVESDGFGSSRVLAGSVPYVDAIATLDPDRRTLYLSLVNHHPSDAAEVRILLRGAQPRDPLTAHVVTGDRPDQINSFDTPDAIRLVSRPVPLPRGDLTWEAPPHSASVLEIGL
jgi:alpha-N-arabinofuranosidase